MVTGGKELGRRCHLQGEGEEEVEEEEEEEEEEEIMRAYTACLLAEKEEEEEGGRRSTRSGVNRERDGSKARRLPLPRHSLA